MARSSRKGRADLDSVLDQGLALAAVGVRKLGSEAKANAEAPGSSRSRGAGGDLETPAENQRRGLGHRALVKHINALREVALQESIGRVKRRTVQDLLDDAIDLYLAARESGLVGLAQLKGITPGAYLKESFGPQEPGSTGTKPVAHRKKPKP